VAWSADRGVPARRVLTDNGGCYRSHAWAAACAELGLTPRECLADLVAAGVER
jgi:transposase InsO family protein